METYPCFRKTPRNIFYDLNKNGMWKTSNISCIHKEKHWLGTIGFKKGGNTSGEIGKKTHTSQPTLAKNIRRP